MLRGVDPASKATCDEDWPACTASIDRRAAQSERRIFDPRASALPFLQEVKARFEKDKFRLRITRDQDGELVSASFRVGRGSVIEIMNRYGVIVVSKIESIKSGNKIKLKIAPVTKPRIIKALDITRNNIEKLVETAIADA
jgi:hypothetical protein